MQKSVQPVRFFERLRILPPLVALLIGGYRPAAHAQDFEKESIYHEKSLQGDFGPGKVLYTGPQPFHVLQYRLTLKAAMTTEEFGGRSEITTLLTAAVDSVVLNAVLLQLDTVTVNGVPATFTSDIGTEELTIRLGRTGRPGDTLHIAIAYRRLPGMPRPSSRQGYYYFPQSLGLPSNLGYTMSEPSDARFWVPCYDQPWEKAPLSMTITVPNGYIAASNGRLAGLTENGDGTATWHWEESHPIATYLMCVTISQFNVCTTHVQRGDGTTMPVQYYVWPADSGRVTAYLPTVAQMIGAFSTRYGQYPFDKYGMTGVVPFAFGGMEHQTITTLNEYLETDPRVVSHELGHQWWGDNVTCGTWADIWLNESFATYSEALWQESAGGSAALTDYMRHSLTHFVYASWQGSVYDPVSQGFNLFDDVVYSKGAWALHMLRGVLGDSTFFHVLLAYRERFSGRSAVTAEFETVADSVSGMDLGWFFNQWIYGPGWPEYTSSHAWVNNILSISLSQTQSASWPVFRMPVTIRAYSRQAGDATFIVWDSLRTQTFAFQLSSRPDSVVVDPDAWLLGEITQSPVTGRPAGAYALFQNYPNPFNGETTISYALPEPQSVIITIFDILGRRVATIIDGNRPAGVFAARFDGAGLASGVYLYRIAAGSFSSTRRMVLVR